MSPLICCWHRQRILKLIMDGEFISHLVRPASLIPPAVDAPLERGVGVTELVWNLRLNECGKLCKRFLPTEVAHLDGNNFRQSFLLDVDLRAARHLG